MRIYTRKGDDGTTGLLHGGRVAKNSPLPTAYGTVDEAQAALGVARAETGDEELGEVLVGLERDLWVLMAELATNPERSADLTPGETRVTGQMVTSLEELIDRWSERFDPPTEFVVPGETRASAALDVARTVVRRAERAALAADLRESQVVPYLNRLSDLVWTLARWEEGQSLTARGR